MRAEARAFTQTQTCMHIHTHTHRHTRTDKDTLAYTHTHTHTHTHIHTHTLCKFVCVCERTCAHAYALAYHCLVSVYVCVLCLSVASKVHACLLGCHCGHLSVLVKLKSLRLEWYTSTIYHCRDAPFWLETLEIQKAYIVFIAPPNFTLTTPHHAQSSSVQDRVPYKWLSPEALL